MTFQIGQKKWDGGSNKIILKIREFNWIKSFKCFEFWSPTLPLKPNPLILAGFNMSPKQTNKQTTSFVMSINKSTWHINMARWWLQIDSHIISHAISKFEVWTRERERERVQKTVMP